MKKQGVFFYILIFLALAAIAAMVIALAPSADVPTVPVVMPSPTAPQEPDSTPGPDPGAELAVTPKTVQAVIATLERAESYSRTLTVTTFWSEGESVRSIEVWKNRGSVRIRESSQGAAVRNVLLGDERRWIWYSDSDAVFESARRPGDEDAWQSLLTYEDVLELDPALISDAGYTDYDDARCIFVRYTSGSLGYESLCYIDIETGLMIGEQTYDGEKLIYSMASSKPDISTPELSLFDPPA